LILFWDLRKIIQSIHDCLAKCCNVALYWISNSSPSNEMISCHQYHEGTISSLLNGAFVFSKAIFKKIKNVNCSR
jgi:hypothetical protein